MGKDVILKFKNGSGGTYNYDSLTNKPKINGVELESDKSFEELGIEEMTPTFWKHSKEFLSKGEKDHA